MEVHILVQIQKLCVVDYSLAMQTIKTLSTSISKLKETATKAVALKPRQEVSLCNDDHDVQDQKCNIGKTKLRGWKRLLQQQKILFP